MKKHLLVYDVDWWVLGKHAKLVKEFHPDLEIASIQSVYNLVGKNGAKKVNEEYEVISTMCLGLAEYLLKVGVRVDSSLAVSYFYFTKNQLAYKEWKDDVELNSSFINKYLSKIKYIGAINPALALTLQRIVPNSEIKYLKQFVDTNHFKPFREKKNTGKIVIGWVGDAKKKSKNYDTLYLPIKAKLENYDHIEFKEATLESYLPHEKMPEYYNSIDVLLITGNNEGGPAPALEAYACGVPVISTNIGYVKEIAPAEARHLILNSNNPEDFIRKVTEIRNNKEKLIEYGKLGRTYVEENFSIESTVPTWVQFLFYPDKIT